LTLGSATKDLITIVTARSFTRLFAAFLQGAPVFVTRSR
jgi:hypothetical protein